MILGGEEEQEMKAISIILADRRVSISLAFDRVISKLDKLAALSEGEEGGLTRIFLLLAGPRT